MFVESGFYIISDKFFTRFPDPYLKGNHEENRPHYYAFKDNKTDLIWMIPVSSKIDKYKKIIEKRKQENKPCDFVTVLKLPNDRESAFIIGDMFPITERYIERSYNIASVPFVLKNETQKKEIEQKARKIISLIRRGVKLSPTQPNVLKIEIELLHGE